MHKTKNQANILQPLSLWLQYSKSDSWVKKTQKWHQRLDLSMTMFPLISIQ